MPRAIWFRIPAVILLSTTPALSHPGHLGTFAGHDHWVAGAAIGLAIALGLWGALKGKKQKDTTSEDAHDEENPEEATA